MEQEKRKFQNKLQAAFSFTDNDLRYNRQLEPSPKQALYAKSAAKSVDDMLALIGILVFSGIIIVVALDVISNFSPLSAVILIILVILLLFSLTSLFYAWQDTLRNPPGTPPIKIINIQGEVGLYRSDGKRFARIEDREFQLTESQFMALRHAQTYRFYYAPELNRILSVEQVE